MAWADYQKSFYDRMFPLAQRASQATGVPAETIFAQAVLESNWGRSAPQNNYFGIKGSGGSQTTREFINGRWVTIQDNFRGYSSMEDSVNGYINFINNPNSRKWGGAKKAATPEEAARELQANGYATDPSYASKLMSIVRGIPASIQNATTNQNTTPNITPPFTGASGLGGLPALPGLPSFEDMNIMAGIGNAISGTSDAVSDAVAAIPNPLEGFLEFFKNLFSQDTAIRFIVVIVGLAALLAAFAALVIPNTKVGSLIQKAI